MLNAATATGGAAVITTTVLGLLGMLNLRADTPPTDATITRTVMMQQHHPDTPRHDEPDQQPQPTEPEVMTVDLDLPDPPPVRPEPLALDLPTTTPHLDAVRVSIAPAERQPSPPRQPAQQPTEATPSGAPEPDQPDAPGPVDADRVDQPPRELPGNPLPEYPRFEQRRHIEGTVVVKMLIDENGRVQDVEHLEGREAFYEAVADVIDRWRFTEPRHNDRPQRVWAIKRFNFEL